jgi:hypothetical protein
LEEIEVHVSGRIERVEEVFDEPADTLQRVVLCLKPTFLIETFKLIKTVCLSHKLLFHDCSNEVVENLNALVLCERRDVQLLKPNKGTKRPGALATLAHVWNAVWCPIKS